MFFLHTLAHHRWPFLNDAFNLIDAPPKGEDYAGYYWGDDINGLKLEYWFQQDKIVLSVDRRGGRAPQAFEFGKTLDSRAHEIYRQNYERGSLPWLIHGPMKILYRTAWHRKWGFLEGSPM